MKLFVKPENYKLILVFGAIILVRIPAYVPQYVGLTLVGIVAAVGGYSSNYSVPKTATFLTPAYILAVPFTILIFWDRVKDGYTGYRLVDVLWIAPLLLGSFWLFLALCIAVGSRIRRGRENRKEIRGY